MRQYNMKHIIRLTVIAVSFAACSRQGYHQAPFGGMKGQVQEAVIYHIMPPDWRTSHDSLMYISASAYDIEGNEICSVLMDSLGRIQSQAESIFENGICVRSTQKAGVHRVIAQIDLKSAKKGRLIYSKKTGNKTTTLEIRERRCFKSFKSTVWENGKCTTTSTIKTDAGNRPVQVSTTDASGQEILEENTFSEEGDIVEKHVKTVGTNRDDVTTTEYVRFDDHGNWIEARTYNKIHMAREILRREIKYWP